jgi:hypothetical protein
MKLTKEEKELAKQKREALSKFKQSIEIVAGDGTVGLIRGSYGKATAWMRSQSTYTRAQLMQYLADECGKSLEIKGSAIISPAGATATILLSPRGSSDRGDCRGNRNNPWGHLAYNESVSGKGKNQVFKFVVRDTALPSKKVELKALRNLSKGLDNDKEMIHNDNNEVKEVAEVVKDTEVASGASTITS